MAKQRYIDTKFWSDGYIVELDPLERYLFIYLLTNEHTNICGIYELPLRVMAFETGLDKELLPKMLARFTGKVEYIGSWVCIKNFIKHQSTSSKTVQIGINEQLQKVPSDVVDKLIGYGYPIDTQEGHIIYLNTNTNTNSNTNTNLNNAELNSAVPAVIDLFKTINPVYKKWFNNTTQRTASHRLLEKFTLERLAEIIAFLPKTNATKYAPTITTPLQLEDKMAALIAFIQKEGTSKSKIAVL